MKESPCTVPGISQVLSESELLLLIWKCRERHEGAGLLRTGRTKKKRKDGTQSDPQPILRSNATGHGRNLPSDDSPARRDMEPHSLQALTAVSSGSWVSVGRGLKWAWS